MRKVFDETKYLISLSHYEGMPLFVIEALSRGCIAILSNIPAHKEIYERYPNQVLIVNHAPFNFNDIDKLNPKSVTVFLDTCYSGSSRNTDTLISSRPIAIVAKNKPIPNNFNVFSASAGDQTAKPLEEAKHGMFSYFLMKGMEGYADTNKDKLITMAELHGYVLKNVTQQSSGSQTPEFQGNGDKLLVKFE